jgi:dihydroorotate dehydrogenase electron transfer subunit
MRSLVLPILEHSPEGRDYRRLRLALPEGVQFAARPGQYVHVLAAEEAFSPSCDPLLRRAFSILRLGEGWFEVLYRVGGRGTQMLSRRRVGDFVDVLGPLGNGFTDAAPQEPLLLVGGGIGVPPMIFASQSVSHETIGAGKRDLEAIVGARSSVDVVGAEELRELGAEVFVATDDGSMGRKALVTEPLRERLEHWRQRGRAPEVWACGPWPMLGAVARVCAEAGASCQVSMEENMPCGIGVCNGCVVPVAGAGDEFGRYKRICVEGPVLEAGAVEWGEPLLAPQGPSLAGVADDNLLDGGHQGASQ